MPRTKVIGAAVAAAVLMTWVLSSATLREFAVTGVVLAAATLAYLVRNRAQSNTA